MVYENACMTYASWHLVDKVYFSDITVKNIYECFTRKMAAKAGWHWNYVTATLRICTDLDWRL